MCTPFWKMSSSDHSTYLTYLNANTFISGDLSRSVCASFRANISNADDIIFSIGSSLVTWPVGAGCNRHFALSIVDAGHISLYGICGAYDNNNIVVGQNAFYDGAIRQINVTYDNTVLQPCIYLNLQSPECLT